MSNKNLSILFTGQGSQYPEMGEDLVNKYNWVKNRYDISSEILGYDVLKAQKNSDLINLTEYSQPMIFIFSSIIIDICRDNLSKNLSNLTLAGHSLGEYLALYFAKSLNFEEMLTLVKFRGESMSIVSNPRKYSMYAILKKEDQIIDKTLFGDGIYIANLNSDKQIVICGLKEKLDKFKEQNPIGKFIPLNVSAPFHSNLMIESSKIFVKKTANINFKKVNYDIISNHQLTNYQTLPITKYINQLSLQMHSPVMWSDTIKRIINSGVENFIEIGPKKTLLNFIPKNFVGEKTCITNSEDIKHYV
tara:strand:+ start:1449 stop:2360 length:912 start_codon:yes stop_codon:yes gene_type:complete